MVKSGYTPVAEQELLIKNNPFARLVSIGHRLDSNSNLCLKIAEADKQYGFKNTYYVRKIRDRFPQNLIEGIQINGQRTGYLYNELNECSGDPHLAVMRFQRSIEQLRLAATVESIATLRGFFVKYDNRQIWKFYDPVRFGVSADFSLLSTDTKCLNLKHEPDGWTSEKSLDLILSFVKGREAFIRQKYSDSKYKSNNSGKKPQIKISNNASADGFEVREHDNSEIISSFKNTNSLIKALEKGELASKLYLQTNPAFWPSGLVDWQRLLFMRISKKLSNML